MSIDLDEYERKAHDIICMCRYGGIGGSVDTKLLERVANYLRGSAKPVARPLLTAPAIRMPVAPIPMRPALTLPPLVRRE